MGTRDNNGVRSKVYHDYGKGSENRGGSQAGKEGAEGGLMPVGGEIDRNEAPGQDMTCHSGPKGSSGKERDNGGVGNMFGGTGDMGEMYKN